MDLLKAHSEGLPLVIETGIGGARLMAEIFLLPDRPGVVFVDIGWPASVSHAYHVVEGEVRETDEGWRIGDKRVRVAFPGERLYAEHQEWLRIVPALGDAGTRERCWADILQSGVLERARSA